MKRIIKLTDELISKSGLEIDIKEIKEEDRIIKRYSMSSDISINKDEEKVASGIISAISLDADGDVVLPEAIDTKRYEKNGIVLFNHNLDEPIGRTVGLTKTAQNILAKVVFGSTQKANTVYSLVKDGILKTFSIGFIPKNYEMKGSNNFKGMTEKLNSLMPNEFTPDKINKIKRIITDAILFEFSVVTIPANEDAVILAVKSLNPALAVKSLNPAIKEVNKPEIKIIGHTIKSNFNIKVDPIVILGRDPQDYLDLVKNMIKG